MYKNAKQWSKIRNRILKEGISISQVVRETGIARNTIRRMLANKVPTSYLRNVSSFRGKLDPFLEKLDNLLLLNQQLPLSERQSITAIFNRLQSENGYDGSYSSVLEYSHKHNKNNENKRESFDDPVKSIHTILKFLPERESLQLLRILLQVESKLDYKSLNSIFKTTSSVALKKSERQKMSLDLMGSLLAGSFNTKEIAQKIHATKELDRLLEIQPIIATVLKFSVMAIKNSTFFLGDHLTRLPSYRVAPVNKLIDRSF